MGLNMNEQYIIVNSEILPPYLNKVIEARNLIEDGTAKDVSDAVRQVGISRSTFYKYQGKVKQIASISEEKHAILSMMMSHQVGLLWHVLQIISTHGYSVWTINQNPPINGKANVVITLEFNKDKESLNALVNEISIIPGLSRVLLLGTD